MKVASIIMLYKENELSISDAISASGGVPRMVLERESVISFLSTLAQNNIHIDAKYVKPTR